MSNDLTIRIPDGWTDSMVCQAIAQAVEAAVVVNTIWYLAMWDAGEDPKCCPKCAGVKYVPAPPGEQWFVDTAPVLLDKGYASCESAAAMHTAHKRADGYRNLIKGVGAPGTPGTSLMGALNTVEGRRAWDAAKAAYRIKLEPSDQQMYWHVVSIDEGVRHDTTLEMDR